MQCPLSAVAKGPRTPSRNRTLDASPILLRQHCTSTPALSPSTHSIMRTRLVARTAERASGSRSNVTPFAILCLAVLAPTLASARPPRHHPREPSGLPAPDRELPWGDINFLSTSDTHGEPNRERQIRAGRADGQAGCSGINMCVKVVWVLGAKKKEEEVDGCSY